MRQQLLEREPALRRMAARQQGRYVGVGRRPVHESQRLAQRTRRVARAQRRRQAFERRIVGQQRQGLLDQARQALLPHALGQRIDRRQGLVGNRLAIDALVAGVHHLQALRPGAHVAVDTQASARRKLLSLRGAEMEEAQQQGAGAGVGDRQAQLRTEAEAALAGRHHALDLRRRARHQFPDRGQAGAVLVAQGQVEPQVLHALDAEARKGDFQRRADAAQRRQLAFSDVGRWLAVEWHAASMPTAALVRQRRPALQSRTRIASISTAAPRGSAATPIAARAGYGCRK